MGLPVVATDIRGCRQVVDDGVNGLLVPVEDHVALADALRSLVRDPHEARPHGSCRAREGAGRVRRARRRAHRPRHLSNDVAHRKGVALFAARRGSGRETGVTATVQELAERALERHARPRPCARTTVGRRSPGSESERGAAGPSFRSGSRPRPRAPPSGTARARPRPPRSSRRRPSGRRSARPGAPGDPGSGRSTDPTRSPRCSRRSSPSPCGCACATPRSRARRRTRRAARPRSAGDPP